MLTLTSIRKSGGYLRAPHDFPVTPSYSFLLLPASHSRQKKQTFSPDKSIWWWKAKLKT